MPIPRLNPSSQPSQRYMLATRCLALGTLMLLIGTIYFNSYRELHTETQLPNKTVSTAIAGGGPAESNISPSSVFALLPMGSAVPPTDLDQGQDITTYQAVTNDGPKELDPHQQRLFLLFVLAVGMTILVQMVKAFIRFSGWLIMLATMGVVIEGAYLILKHNAWPKFEETILPQIKEKMPSLPPIKEKIPFLKKKEQV